MKAKTLWSLVTEGRLELLRSVGRLSSSHYRACFAVAAARSGLFRALDRGPRSLLEIAAALSIDQTEAPALEAWLEVGTGTGVLRRHGDGFALSRTGRLLASVRGDAVVALLEEMLELHTKLILETPGRLAKGERFTLDDLDGQVIARSSRLIEPFITEAVHDFVPSCGEVRLLEIGCGSGIHIRTAASLNPDLKAVGVELSPEVAETARAHLREWGLNGRASVEVSDIRTRVGEAEFDLATMHQNIYYFSETEQVPLLARVRSMLRPGGRLLLTTACRGGSPGMSVLSLWGALTEGCSALPEPKQLERRLVEAGFREVRRTNLLAPFDSFYAFFART